MPDIAVPQLRQPQLPAQLGLYYGGAWHEPVEGGYAATINPGSGAVLANVAQAGAADTAAAIAAARAGFLVWRDIPPLERAKLLREAAAILRRNAAALALLDAANCGNPVSEMGADVFAGAAILDFFAGMVTEMKGASIPMGPERINFSVREPLGVVARIVAFNHPLLFTVAKMAAPLAAGNAVIIKPPEQAPLAPLRVAELFHELFPPGVLNILNGGLVAGETLVAHKDVAMLGVVGSIATGRAIMRGAAARLKPLLLELGGKNALIALPDADPEIVAEAIAAGMNFTWCGQSCGSTSRAFVHADIYEAVLARLAARCAHFRPGDPTDPATTMGAIISRAQHERILGYIESAKAEGARLICGGGVPADPALAGGLFIEPTVFADVTPDMRIATEEIFGPVLAVSSWRDEGQMLADVNALDYGLTCAIWTNDLEKAHRLASRVQAGFVWVNEIGKHFLGAPFGGVKQSGIGREECLGELLAFTQEKNIHINLRRVAPAVPHGG
jgi:acyl-CoA reductase-like NAD-dependent aldehyde dehydrogenase